MISPLMESIMPNAYKESRSEQMQREQTRRAAQKLQQKVNALKSGTNVKTIFPQALRSQILCFVSLVSLPLPQEFTGTTEKLCFKCLRFLK